MDHHWCVLGAVGGFAHGMGGEKERILAGTVGLAGSM